MSPSAESVTCGMCWKSVGVGAGDREMGKRCYTWDPNREKGFWRSKIAKSSDGEWHWRQYSSSSFAWYTVPYKSDTNMDIESFSKISAEDWVWNFLRSAYSPTGNLENVRPLCIEPWSKQMNSKNDRQTTQICWARVPSPDPSWWLWSMETMACLASFEIIYIWIYTYIHIGANNRQHPKTTT